jgi:hypothetical protein
VCVCECEEDIAWFVALLFLLFPRPIDRASFLAVL